MQKNETPEIISGAPASVLRVARRDVEALFGAGGGPGKHISFAIERRNQTVNPLTTNNGIEFGPTGCDLADRAIEIDVGDKPGAALLTHHVINLDGFAVCFDDCAANPNTADGRLFAGNLQSLTMIAVKPIGEKIEFSNNTSDAKYFYAKVIRVENMPVFPK